MNEIITEEVVLYCGQCHFWQNRPENNYNKIHEEIKECGKDNTVHKKTRSCLFFKAKTDGIRRRKITTC